MIRVGTLRPGIVDGTSIIPIIHSTCRWARLPAPESIFCLPLATAALTALPRDARIRRPKPSGGRMRMAMCSLWRVATPMICGLAIPRRAHRLQTCHHKSRILPRTLTFLVRKLSDQESPMVGLRLPVRLQPDALLRSEPRNRPLKRARQVCSNSSGSQRGRWAIRPGGTQTMVTALLGRFPPPRASD